VLLLFGVVVVVGGVVVWRCAIYGTNIYIRTGGVCSSSRAFSVLNTLQELLHVAAKPFVWAEPRPEVS